MTAAKKAHVNRTVIGAGEVYLDVLDEAGSTQGERYLGGAVSAAIAVASERTEVFDPDGPTAQKIVDIQRTIDRSFSMVLLDMSLDNWAVFLGGETATQAVAAGDAPAAGETITVLPGRSYQLGVSADRPLGFGRVAAAGGANAPGAGRALKVEPDAGGGEYAAGQFGFDLERGRLFVAPGVAGGIAAATDVKVFYTVADDDDYAYVRSGADANVYAAIRYLENAPTSAGRDIYIRRASIGPDGAVDLKDGRNQEQRIGLTASILTHGDHPQVLIRESA